MNVLLMGTFNSLNKGDETRLKCTVEMLKNSIPGIRLSFLSYNYDIDRSVYGKYGIDIIKAPYQKLDSGIVTSMHMSYRGLIILSSALFWNIFNKDFNCSLDELKRYDAFIDISGESIGDHFGRINLLFCLYQISLGILLEKQTIICAQTIGPLNDKICRFAARQILNRTNLITLRDKDSLNYLKSICITEPPIYVVADPAFTLEQISKEESISIFNREHIDLSNRPLIGLALSRGSYKRGISKGKLEYKYLKYIETMSKFVDYLIERLDARVVFFPHVVTPKEDDRESFRMLHDQVKYKHKIQLLEGDYACEELKGLMSNCDIFIGSRMHANIAALSMKVPTIAIAYSSKMPSLMEMLGQSKYCCDVETITLKELVLMVEDILDNSDSIKVGLSPKIDEAKKLALNNILLIKKNLEFLS